MILCRFITVEQFPLQNADVSGDVIFFLKGCGCNGNPNIVDFFFRNDGFPAAAFYLEAEIRCFYALFLSNFRLFSFFWCHRKHINLESDDLSLAVLRHHHFNVGQFFQIINDWLIHFFLDVSAFPIVSEHLQLEMSLTTQMQINITHIGILLPLSEGEGIEIGEKFYKIARIQILRRGQRVIVHSCTTIHHPPVFFQLQIIPKNQILNFKLYVSHRFLFPLLSNCLFLRIRCCCRSIRQYNAELLLQPYFRILLHFL